MPEMTCLETVDGLMDYVDDVLAADRRRSFEAHLAGCPRCVEFLASYRETPRIVRRCSDAALPEGVAGRLKAVLRAHGSRARRPAV